MTGPHLTLDLQRRKPVWRWFAVVLLVRGDLRVAADAIRLSRRTLGTIESNLIWSFGYNIAPLPLAASGLLIRCSQVPRWPFVSGRRQ